MENDVHRSVLFGTGCEHNIENCLGRFVQDKLHPVQRADVVPGAYGYCVSTLTGPVKVTGYGLAEATVNNPDGTISKVGH